MECLSKFLPHFFCDQLLQLFRQIKKVRYFCFFLG